MAQVYALSWAYAHPGQEQPFILSFPEGVAQTFKKGDPVKLNASGQVILATEAAGYLGIAGDDASGTTDKTRPVIIVGRDDVLVASQSNGGATQVSAQSQVGLQCSYIRSTIAGHLSKTTVDTSDVVNLNFEIIGLYDPAATADGRVYVRAVPAKLIARG